MPIEDEIREVAEEVKEVASPDYGQTAWNPETKTVLWVPADYTSDEEAEAALQTFLEIEGVENAEGEAEQSLPYSDNPPELKKPWALVAGMTRPQMLREWERLGGIGTISNEYDFGDGWWIGRATSPLDAGRIGRFMRNCWQHMYELPENLWKNIGWNPEEGQKISPGVIEDQGWKRYYALFDPDNIPVVAFNLRPVAVNQGGDQWVYDPERFEVDSPLAARNDEPTQEHLQRVWEWAQSMPHQMYFMRGGDLFEVGVDPEQEALRGIDPYNWNRNDPAYFDVWLKGRPWSLTGNIFDPIHQDLDQKVFQGIKLRQKHVDFIKRLYFRALKIGLGIPLGESDPYASLYLTGSLTTYQWAETSDADVSVFPDYELIWKRLGIDPNEARKLLISLSIEHIDGMFLPGTTHPLQFFVVPNGTLPTDMYQPGLRSAYSILEGIWIVPPERERAHNIETEMPEVFARARAMADKMSEMLDYDKEQARQLWHDIHKKRQLDQRAGLGDFCLAPETKILTTEYKWVPIRDLDVGDTLIGFDEHPQEKEEKRGTQRTFQMAIVTSKESKLLPSYRVSTDRNPDVIASGEHLWLVRGKKRMVIWKATDELVPGDKIIRFGQVWGEAKDPISAAYLAGLFDGEGHITKLGRLSFSQKEGIVAERGRECLRNLDFNFSITEKKYPGGQYESGMNHQVFGGVAESMRFLYQVPTVRLQRNNPNFWIGRQISPKGRNVEINNCYTLVESVVPVGEQEVVALGTSTRTLIAEGLYSHNSEANIVYKYLLNQGLFERIRNELGEYIAKRPDHWEEDWVCPNCGNSGGRDAIYEDPEGGFECRQCGFAIVSHIKMAVPPAAEWEQFAEDIQVIEHRKSKTADWKEDRVTTKVIYDFKEDRILLGTMADAAELPDHKILGEYKDGNVTLFEAEKQWVNPEYFYRLWNYSFPYRELNNVYFRRSDESEYKLKHLPRGKK